MIRLEESFFTTLVAYPPACVGSQSLLGALLCLAQFLQPNVLFRLATPSLFLILRAG